MKKLFSFILTALFIAGLAACSNKDDEPDDYQPTYDGVAIYLNAIDKLYTSDGKPAFTPTSTEGIYIGQADSEAIARNFICDLLQNEDWDGKNVTVNLGENGEEGSLKVISEGLEDGIYDEVVINIKGDLSNYEPYTLQIVSKEKAENENGVGKDVVIIK